MSRVFHFLQAVLDNMSDIINLIYGGSGSGKSEYAESLVLDYTNNASQKYYVATMIPYGKDAEERIMRHKKLRDGKGFETIECAFDLGSVKLEKLGSTVLLECLGNLTANEMFRENCVIESKKVSQKILLDINEFVKNNKIKKMIIVTNNIFDDGIDYDEDSKNYMEALAKINCELAKKAYKVVEVIAGIPVVLKG